MSFFSRVNEYNIQLEKILEKKYFSSDAKNLLQSMVYKVENSYNDYHEVKRIRKEKDEFILEIIKTIEEYAHYIKLEDPKKENDNLLKKNDVLAITNEKNGNILTYPTEIAMLYAISDLRPKYFYIKNNMQLKTAFQKMLVYGYNKNNLEILTDFNGWSWDIEKKHTNFIYNLMYQNLLILFGIKAMDQWMKYRSTDIDYISKIKEKSFGTEYYFWICKILYLLEKNNQSLQRKINIKQEEYKKFLNSSKFLEEIKNNKAKLTKAVEKIDKALNNEKILQNELIKRNKKLDNKKKIKNVKYLKVLMEKDRKMFIAKIKELSELLIPENFLNRKSEAEFYNRIASDKTDLAESIIESQKEFIKLIKSKINKVNTNDDLIDMIFQLRYYKNLYVNSDEKIKDIKELELPIKNLEKKIITLSCKNAILKIFSMDINLNYQIISNILDTKIIDLEQIKVKIDFDKENLIINEYDKEVFEKEFIIPFSGNKKDLEIKKDKMAKVFI